MADENKTRERLAQALFEAAPQGILLADGDGRLLDVNRAAEQMFGYRRAALAGQSVELLIPPHPGDANVAHLERDRSEPVGRSMGREGVGRRQDGSTFPVEVHIGSIEADAGITVVAFVSDITGRKRIEAHLRGRREARAHREELAALGARVDRISREMNNPLAIIWTRIELMLWEAEGRSLPREVVEDLQVLHRHVLRVARSVQALQSFARETPGEQSGGA